MGETPEGAEAAEAQQRGRGGGPRPQGADKEKAQQGEEECRDASGPRRGKANQAKIDEGSHSKVTRKRLARSGKVCRPESRGQEEEELAEARRRRGESVRNRR